jgi:hypothetical protein
LDEGENQASMDAAPRRKSSIVLSPRLPKAVEQVSKGIGEQVKEQGEQPALGSACTAVAQDGSPTERIRMWLDVMGTCEQFLLAGLRREIGPDGDLQAAYRRWYAEQMEEHDRMMVHLMERFARCGGQNAT